MDTQNKCCLNCKHFKNEDFEGWGLCNVEDSTTKCDDMCDYHDLINNGWTEITPDNVDEIRKTQRQIVIMNPKEWSVPEMSYGILKETLVLYSVWGGYYYYFLPDLKIE